MCEGTTPEAAKLSLYDTHESISHLTLLHVGNASRAKVGDVLEPIDNRGIPTGKHYRIVSLTDDLPNAISGRYLFGDGIHPLSRDGLYIYREIS
jgi:hypothetical protein